MTGSIYELDTSELRCSYVLDCDSGVQIRLSPLARRVVTARWSGASFDEIARACSDARRSLTADDVRLVHERVRSQVDDAERRRSRWGRHGAWLRVRLLPPALVGRLADRLSFVFAPAVAVAAILLASCIAAYVMLTHPFAAPQGPLDVAGGYGLFLLTCVAHELGHAAACRRFGVRAGSIGLTLYLVFPAFYSDVSRIWRLRRWQRVTVDAAGIYLQCSCAAAYALLALTTHAPVWSVAIALPVGAVLLDLNPLLRFDGYWIASDALGVDDLYAQVGATLRRFMQRLAGSPDPVTSAWPKATLAALSVYALAALAGGVWFAGRLFAHTAGEGRWAVAALAALAKGEVLFSFAFAVRLGALFAGAFTLAYGLAVLLRFLRRTAVPPESPPRTTGRRAAPASGHRTCRAGCGRRCRCSLC